MYSRNYTMIFSLAIIGVLAEGTSVAQDSPTCLQESQKYAQAIRSSAQAHQNGDECLALVSQINEINNAIDGLRSICSAQTIASMRTQAGQIAPTAHAICSGITVPAIH